MTDDNGVIDRFVALFEGYKDAHGRTEELGDKNEKGKLNARSWTAHETVTRKKWEDHLAGRAGIGIIPLMNDGFSLKWGVIDIDLYQNPSLLFDVQARIEALKLPLVVCRSKSGGAHCFCFLKEPMPADEVMAILKSWSITLGFPGVEVFPKQISRSEGDSGNWLNMPYYKAGKTERYAVKNNAALSLAEFVALAENKQCSPEQMRQTTVEDSEVVALFLEGPPCLKALYKIGGFPQGTRNEGMYNVGVYLKKRYGESWVQHFETYNQKLCVPVLTRPEMETLEKSLSKKGYDYRCKQQPICNHCDKKACKGQKFGVGNSGLPFAWTGLEKHKGDPVIWYAIINDTRILLKTDELLDVKAFGKRIMDELSILMRPLTPAKWAKEIDERLDAAVEYDVPEASGTRGQFLALLSRYLHGNAQAQSRDEVLTGTPWLDPNGIHLFKADSLYRFLNNQGFRPPSNHHIWQWVKDAHGEHIGTDSEIGEHWKIKVEKPLEPARKDAPEFTTEHF